jgi:hypothetical protein
MAGRPKRRARRARTNAGASVWRNPRPWEEELRQSQPLYAQIRAETGFLAALDNAEEALEHLAMNFDDLPAGVSDRLSDIYVKLLDVKMSLRP